MSYGGGLAVFLASPYIVKCILRKKKKLEENTGRVFLKVESIEHKIRTRVHRIDEAWIWTIRTTQVQIESHYDT